MKGKTKVQREADRKAMYDAAFHAYISDMARMGGKAAAQSLTKEQRIERARKGGKARQAKARKEGGK